MVSQLSTGRENRRGILADLALLQEPRLQESGENR